MNAPEIEDIDLICIDRSVWIAEHKIGLPVYDFPFDILLPCSRSLFGAAEIEAVSRCGAVEDYDAFFARMLERGIRLIHSPEQHQLCSELPAWYPLLEGLTPESRWFDIAPSAEEAGALFGWPLFMKGSRQTSRLKAVLSIIRGPSEYEAAVKAFASDRLLHWQQIVLRRFIPLRPVAADMGERIPASFEFRTFWWKGQLAGEGPYFAEFARYHWNAAEREAALAVAQIAADRLKLPFVVIDLAQTEAGDWIIVEINDAQESGYAGVQPLSLWQTVAGLEKGVNLKVPPGPATRGLD